MKISDIDSSAKMVDFDNFFDVYEDLKSQGSPYFFNLNTSLYFGNVPKLAHTVKHDMFWTTLSYELYGTTRLWWVLMKVNNVPVELTFEPVRSGDVVAYIDKDNVRYILEQM